MERPAVHKFGGTSLAGAARMRVAARVVADSPPPFVVVASAMAGVTDRLLGVASLAAAGRTDELAAGLAWLRERHEAVLAELGGRDATSERMRDDVRARLVALETLLSGVAALGELSARTKGAVVSVGEKLSVRLLTLALIEVGIDAIPLDADEFLETDDGGDDATPLAGVAERGVAAALQPYLERGRVPVVTGFCGRGPDGATTTLGRSGSDYTATIVGAALDATRVTIWTDVDGVLTADPRIVPEARVIPQLNFREAAELSFFGARVLHPRTMIPAAARGIPIVIRNPASPDRPGTVVDGRFTPGSHPVKAISASRGQALVSVEGKGMAGVPGIAARVFTALCERGISVTMISQSSAESSICLAVTEAEVVDAELALRRAFRLELAHGDVEDILVRRHVGLVAAVGLGMAQTPGVAARVLDALRPRRVNVLAIAQGASELNISLAIDEGSIHDAVRSMHAALGLHRLDSGVDAPQAFDLLVLGLGRVGRELLRQLLDRGQERLEGFGLRPRVVGVADSRGHRIAPAGLTAAELAEILALKEAGESLGAADGDGSPGAFLAEAFTWRLVRPVLIDVTAFAGSTALFAAAIAAGCDVVTANKVPLAGPRADFRSLVAAARERGAILRGEATVGAGLPVVETLEMLVATGDRVRSVEGCFSGTLGFVVTELERGVAFSDAVAAAVAKGFAEPDPVVDLTGDDVAKKALILARFAGFAEPEDGVRAETLVDPELRGLEPEQLRAALATYDAAFAARVAAARADGCALRYVARVADGAIDVGLRAVPADSPLGRLDGPDNMIVVTTDRYAERPLVVSGPGAGIPVTAMAVLSDLLRVAAVRS